MKINIKSDFDFTINASSANVYENSILLLAPIHDFVGRIFVPGHKNSSETYTFSRINNVRTNYYDSNYSIQAIVAKHNLPAGPLYCELTMQIPDTHYRDGVRTTVMEFPLGITLVQSDAKELEDCVSVKAETISKTVEVPADTSNQPKVVIWSESSAPAGNDLVAGTVYLFTKSYTSIDPCCVTGTMWKYDGTEWEEYTGEIYYSE